MKISLVLLCVLSATLLFSCKGDCNSKADGNCACIEIYAPVCGCDGKTYGNSCHAECSGITDYSEGECQ